MSTYGQDIRSGLLGCAMLEKFRTFISYFCLLMVAPYSFLAVDTLRKTGEFSDFYLPVCFLVLAFHQWILAFAELTWNSVGDRFRRAK
jgi:hypothetical protein